MPLLEWASAAFTKPGHSDSGDLYLVKTLPQGLLAAVIDGIGHGSEAASVANLARDVVNSYADEGVVSLIHRCHRRLYGTRGVVMSLASIDAQANQMNWVGVGNVQCVVLTRRPGGTAVENSLLLRAGVVGVRLPSMKAEVQSINRGDTIVFATDGVKLGFDRGLASTLSPQSAADQILAEYSDASDDALVLVGRYLGET